MVFSDLFFLFAFLPAFALCYVLSHRSNWVLVIFSLLFYAWGEPVYVFLLMASVVVNYYIGLLIDRSDGRKRHTMLVIGVVVDVAVLATFKYLSFFVSELIDLDIPVPEVNISLPIGISFYTFQSISYLVDVYRRQSPVQRSLKDLLLYISMFPQLIAGPIVRYGTVAHEIAERHVTAHDLSVGMMRFLQGLGKKVILANQLSEISDLLLADLSSTTSAWIGIIAFTLQIYFDFSGYSDMAIGIGRCLGFHFPENFNHPYCSRSITEFWRRWHMSLGSFFRDYVYIPLGGNRRHQVFNILVVWMLTGFWHGASWNFLQWGLYFGLIIMAEKYTLLRFIDRVPRWLLHIYSMLIVIVGWGIFYFDDSTQMHVFFAALFSIDNRPATDFLSLNMLTQYGWLWVASIAFCLPLRRLLPTWGGQFGWLRMAARLLWAILLLVTSVALLVGATNNAFLYTRF